MSFELFTSGPKARRVPPVGIRSYRIHREMQNAECTMLRHFALCIMHFIEVRPLRQSGVRTGHDPRIVPPAAGGVVADVVKSVSRSGRRVRGTGGGHAAAVEGVALRNQRQTIGSSKGLSPVNGRRVLGPPSRGRGPDANATAPTIPHHTDRAPFRSADTRGPPCDSRMFDGPSGAFAPTGAAG